MQAHDFRPLFKVRRTRYPLWKQVLLVSGALIFFIVGIFGWLLPVVTGIPFYIAGLILLGWANPSVLRWMNRAEARLSPKWRKRLRHGLDKIPIKKIRESVEH